MAAPRPSRESPRRGDSHPLRWLLLGSALALLGMLRRGRRAGAAGDAPPPADAAPAANPPPAPDAAPRIAQEEDRLHSGRALLWMAAAVAMVLIGVAGPWAMMAMRGAPPPAHLGRGYGPPVPAFAGGLRSGTFGAPGGEPRDSGGGAAADDMARFEWVDRAAGVVRIPIEDAFALWLARHGEAAR